MKARAKRAPKVRKVDERVPVLQACGTGDDAPLFDATDRVLLRAVDGAATVHAIAVGAGRSDADVARSLSRLEERGVITFASAADQQAAPVPQRLKSGMRPALKTIPSDLGVATSRASGNDFDDHERPTVQTEAAPAVQVVDVPGELNPRLTLPGIGPDGVPE